MEYNQYLTIIKIILLTKYGNKNKNYYQLIKKILLRRLGKSIIYYINIYIYYNFSDNG
jgi:hypothetical protein